MRQVTLISVYGDKPPELATLIEQCQAFVRQAFGARFTRYDLRQIHATIVGLERQPGSLLHNANLATYRGRHQAMQFDGWLRFLRQGGEVPLAVQLAGFENREYPFRSRAAIPYERSFSIQGDQVVVMGWPVQGQPLHIPPSSPEEWVQEGRRYPRTLDRIRRAAQPFSILHAYHRTLADVDNDWYFRIGWIDDPAALTAAAISRLEGQVRTFLGARPPLLVDLTLRDLYVASYEDDTLPLSSTEVWSLEDPAVTGAFVASLYR